MGKIYCLMGKSSSGKDTIYKRLMKELPDRFRTVIPYTTRPIRSGEKDGVEYFFRSVPEFKVMESEGRVIESRVYHTVHGDWYYFTAADGQIDLEKNDYLIIMTPEGCRSLKRYFGNENVLPIYIEVEDGLRLLRAVERERSQKSPKYAELCRRYLADENDFSEDKLQAIDIKRRYRNEDLKTCVKNICEDLKG